MVCVFECRLFPYWEAVIYFLCNRIAGRPKQKSWLDNFTLQMIFLKHLWRDELVCTAFYLKRLGAPLKQPCQWCCAVKLYLNPAWWMLHLFSTFLHRALQSKLQRIRKAQPSLQLVESWREFKCHALKSNREKKKSLKEKGWKKSCPPSLSLLFAASLCRCELALLGWDKKACHTQIFSEDRLVGATNISLSVCVLPDPGSVLMCLGTYIDRSQ